MATQVGDTTDTAPGPLPESLYGDLPEWEFKLAPSSTTTIMAALFLALGFTVNMQITERIDAVLFGGVSPLLGIFFFAMWNAAGGMFYGVPGALIVANINPIVANLTATNPLAPTFFATNTLYALPLAIFAYYFKRPGKGMTFQKFAIAHCLAIPLTLIPLSLIHIFVLEFTLSVVAGWYVAGIVFGYAGMFVAYPFIKKLLEAGVVQQ